MESSQLAAWPQTQYTEIKDEDFRRILLARLKDREKHFAELDAKFRELKDTIERESEHIEHLRALLADLGEVLPARATPEATMVNGTASVPVRGKAFVAGNKNENMPARRLEYASMSLSEAARHLLSGGDTLHINDISRGIYVIEDVSQLRQVSATVRSTLAVGVNKGQWERGEEAGTFRMRQKSEATSW